MESHSKKPLGTGEGGRPVKGLGLPLGEEKMSNRLGVWLAQKKESFHLSKEF